MVAADYHGNMSAIHSTISKAEASSADVIIIAGDITHFGSIQDAMNLLSVFRKQPLSVLFVPGNCDPEDLVAEEEKNVRSIHRACYRIEGFSFLGVGGSAPTSFNTPFELTEIEIAEILNYSSNCPIETRLVLVSHSPPENTLVDMTSNGEHVGSSSIRDFITTKKPALVVCGHIHEGRGIDKIGETVVVNPGSAGQGHAALVSLDQRVDVELCSL
jgi:Icc-related predicted phosphoesterase